MLFPNSINVPKSIASIELEESFFIAPKIFSAKTFPGVVSDDCKEIGRVNDSKIALQTETIFFNRIILKLIT